MSRATVSVRDATLADVPRLAELWREVVRRGEETQRLADLATIVERAADDPDSRVVVVELDGAVGGAVMLQVATVTPINLEPVVRIVAPHVFPELRRHGLGRALMDAATAFAEERGIAHLGAGAISSSREANRFLARLGFGPQATLRLGATVAVRAKLESQRASLSRGTGGQIGQVLAVRRIQRRRRSTVSDLSG